MRRTLGIAAGVLTHALFAFTFWRLVPFLWGSVPHVIGNVWIDVPLAAQFGMVHSALLHPSTRKRLERYIASPFYGCFFCIVTCLTLLPMMAYWQSSTQIVWQFSGLPRAATCCRGSRFGSLRRSRSIGHC